MLHGNLGKVAAALLPDIGGPASERRAGCESGAKGDVLTIAIILATCMYGQDHFDPLRSVALVHDNCQSGKRCSDSSIYSTLSAGKYG